MSSFEKVEFGMEYICDYKDMEAYRTSFNHLTASVFGFHLEEWYRKGFWDDRYICHSIVYCNQVIANISVSKCDLILNGAPKKAIQLGTVMTHPDYRGRGLSRFLMNRVLERYEQGCDLFFLFANSNVLHFYPKFGFIPISESQFSLDVTGLPRENGSLRKLNITKEADLELIKQTVLSRKAVSRIFGVERNQGIFMFYALNMFQDCLFYAEKEKAVVVYKQDGETLHLYDVVYQEYIDRNALIPRIIDRDTKSVQFYFTPDLFADHAQSAPLSGNEDQLFVRSDSVPVFKSFRAPITAHA